jgi:hypothetical protein
VRDRSSASRRVEARVRESCVEPKPPWVQVSSRPGARRATRLRARSLGTGRDHARLPRRSPLLETVNRAKRFLARFPRRDRRESTARPRREAFGHLWKPSAPDSVRTYLR